MELRACRPEERESWAEFLDRNFGYQGSQSYRIDFAPLFSDRALARSRVAWVDGKITASATLFPVEAKAGEARLKLGIVGAVATDESHRGQGLSRQLLDAIENQARSLGLAGLVLWSELLDFYQKLGFGPAGRQQIFSLARLPRPERMVAGTPVYGWNLAQVKDLYARHALRAERSSEYWEEIAAIRSCTRVQWMLPDGKIAAYLGFDRGRDLQGIAHEWGGEAQALRALVWAIRESKPDLLWLTHPMLADPISSLLRVDDLVLDSHLALFKPLAQGLGPSSLEQLWFWGLDSL